MKEEKMGTFCTSDTELNGTWPRGSPSYVYMGESSLWCNEEQFLGVGLVSVWWTTCFHNIFTRGLITLQLSHSPFIHPSLLISVLLPRRHLIYDAAFTPHLPFYFSVSSQVLLFQAHYRTRGLKAGRAQSQMSNSLCSRLLSVVEDTTKRFNTTKEIQIPISGNLLETLSALWNGLISCGWGSIRIRPPPQYD